MRTRLADRMARGLRIMVGCSLIAGGAVSAATAPSMGSPASSGITGTSATLGGTVNHDGGATITERGVVFSVTSANSNPQLDGAGVIKVTTSGTTGTFAIAVAPLFGSTQYSWAAFARNSAGTGYTTPATTFTTGTAFSGPTGYTLPVTTSPPSLATQWVICSSGTFPDTSAAAGTGMSDAPVLGEIRNVAFSPSLSGFSSQFLPCDGRLINVSSNTALFALLGTTYGGNGSTTFALPDLRGRVPVHFSATNPLGAMTGAEATPLSVPNLPPHTHTVPAGANTGSTGSGTGVSIQQPTLALNLRIVETAATASVGWVRVFAFSGAAGLTACDGGTYNRSGESWAALFSKIGTTYGVGNGRTTFDVPDLRHRSMIGAGTGAGLTARTLGQSDGTATATLAIATMPAHDHTLPVGTTGGTGNGGSIGTMSSFLVLNPTIALSGNSTTITTLPVLGEMRFRADSGAPAGWISCNGGILSISQNPALFALLGTAFGGNGSTTFGLPDTRGRSVTSADNGAGVPADITSRNRGAAWGAEAISLSAWQLPSHTHTITTYDANSPEIGVTGGGLAITDGDGSPSLTDHTDFGSVARFGGSASRTFTIVNTGGGTLTLSGLPLVAIGGPHAADFTISRQPATTVAGMGGSTTFQVKFDPTAAGMRTATVSLANNDSGEDPFDFTIQGTASDSLIVTSPPALATQWVICVSGPFPANDPAGTGMSDAPVLGEIRNVAFDPGLSGFSSQFLPCDGRLLNVSSNTALSSLLGSTYGGNGSSNFALPDLRGRVPVHYSSTTPLGATMGAETTTLAVTNLPPHIHTAPGGTTTGSAGGGTGFSIQQPALALNVRIVDKAPTASVGWIRIFAFFGETGLTGCDGGAYSRSIGNWTALFSKIGTTYGAGNGSTTFNVPDLRDRTMLGSGAGNWLTARLRGQSGGSGTATLHLAAMPPHFHTLSVGPSGYTGGSEPFGTMSPFLVLNANIALAGNSTTITGDPVLGEVRFRADGPVPSGWAACNGALLPTASHPTLSGMLGTVYGRPTAVSFAVPDLRGRSLTSADNGSDTLPGGISSRDRGAMWGAETQTLAAEQVPAHTHGYTGPPAREIAVDGNGQNIVDGSTATSLTDHTDFGSIAAAGGTVARVFTIRNIGATDLSLNGTPKVAVSGAGDFTIATQPAGLVAAGGGTATFQVTFDPLAIGVRSAILTIASNDADENPFTFAISGQGLNSIPADITLDPATVDENNPPDAVVGTLATTDVDSGQTFAYSLVPGAGDADNGSFTLSGSVLRLTPSADFETRNSYSVRVRSSDGADSIAKAFTITIRNVNEPPAFAAGANLSHPASFGTPQTLGGWATAIDDGDSTVTQALSFAVSNDNSALFSVQPALSADGTLTYTTNGSPGTATVAVSLTDDSTINGFPALTSAIRTFTISVSVANGTGLAIESIRVLTGGNVLLEFSAISQRTYKIDYSDNLTTWQTAVPALTAAGPLVQWIDQGPPATASPPGTAPRRFYRVSDITP